MKPLCFCHCLQVSAVAILIFLTAAARTRIISSNLWLSFDRLFCGSLLTVYILSRLTLRTLPSVYLPESQAEAGFGINLSLFGEYQVAAQPLTDLAGKLPRNTHLYITATVSDIGVSFEAILTPYREVSLDPIFGLPNKK